MNEGGVGSWDLRKYDDLVEMWRQILWGPVPFYISSLFSHYIYIFFVIIYEYVLYYYEFLVQKRVIDEYIILYY